MYGDVYSEWLLSFDTNQLVSLSPYLNQRMPCNTPTFLEACTDCCQDCGGLQQCYTPHVVRLVLFFPHALPVALPQPCSAAWKGFELAHRVIWQDHESSLWLCGVWKVCAAALSASSQIALLQSWITCACSSGMADDRTALTHFVAKLKLSNTRRIQTHCEKCELSWHVWLCEWVFTFHLHCENYNHKTTIPHRMNKRWPCFNSPAELLHSFVMYTTSWCMHLYQVIGRRSAGQKVVEYSWMNVSLPGIDFLKKVTEKKTHKKWRNSTGARVTDTC